MKLRDIFLLISCCFAVFSCSMEDDTIMNDVEKNFEDMEEATTEMYTAIDFNLGLNDMMTKSTEITGDDPQHPAYDPDNSNHNENHISSSNIFILENNQIIYIVDGGGDMSGEDSEGSPITVKEACFVTKYREGRRLTAYAVINAPEGLFKNVKIGDGVEAITNHEISGHLTANTLVKIGCTEFVIDDTYPRSDSPKSFTYENAKSLVIDVHHIAARLDFKEFTYELKDWKSNEDVKVSFEARFENIKTIGNLNGTEVYQKDLENSSFNKKPFTAYSYRSQEENDGNYVRLYLKVTVTEGDIDKGGKTKVYERTYDVNDDVEKDVDHNYIMGGYLYNIAVNWTITPKWADSSIEFYTKDWEYEKLGDIEI